MQLFLRIKMNAKKFHDEQNIRIFNKDGIQESQD